MERSEKSHLKWEIAAGATLLDSSLRCAAFRMTGEGRFVQNDRVNCCAALRMTVGGDDGGDVGVGIGLKVCFCVILP